MACRAIAEFARWLTPRCPRPYKSLAPGPTARPATVDEAGDTGSTMTAPPHANRGRGRRPPTRKIVYWFPAGPRGHGTFLPLVISAYKLISYSREALVTSQQEAQLRRGGGLRQLNAAIEGIKAQMSRLSEAIAALPKLPAPGSRIVADRALMERLLGADLLSGALHAEGLGSGSRARRRGFPRSAVGGRSGGRGAAMQAART